MAVRRASALEWVGDTMNVILVLRSGLLTAVRGPFRQCDRTTTSLRLFALEFPFDGQDEQAREQRHQDSLAAFDEPAQERLRHPGVALQKG